MADIPLINSPQMYDSLVAELDGSEELILFKASPRCAVSLNIEHFFNGWFAGTTADNTLKAYKVDVIRNREVSQYIAAKSGIKHESPQVLWFASDGSLKWHGSHFDINQQELDKQLRK